MTEPERNALLAAVTDPELRGNLAHLGEMIDRDPWPAQPEAPSKPEPRYSVEPYKGFYAVMKEVAGHKKELVVVAVYKKGAQEVVRRLEGADREIVNLRHSVRRLELDRR